MTLDELICEGEDLISRSFDSFFGKAVPLEPYEEWKRISLLYLQNTYPNHPQIKTFELYVSKDNSLCYVTPLISILKAFKTIDPRDVNVDYDAIIKNIFEHFHVVARQLKRRYSNRDTILIKDEYDVQDLLNALFHLHFNDVRPEEWTPSYAGGCNRIDFLLKDEEIAIEVKMTRAGLKDKELGEQLIIDIAKYRQHPNCKSLYCFVYDPEGFIRNPRGVENDLEKLKELFPVKVFIRPL